MKGKQLPLIGAPNCLRNNTAFLDNVGLNRPLRVSFGTTMNEVSINAQDADRHFLAARRSMRAVAVGPAFLGL